MNKTAIKAIRNKMICDMWEEKKAEWTMSDLASFFNLTVVQIFRILKETKKVEKDNQLKQKQ